MDGGITLSLVAAHTVAAIALAAFGLHRLALAVRHARLPGAPTAGEPPPASPRWPSVTVQIPLYNERYVAERVVRAAAALDYPRDRLEIQVLDDSTDVTTERVARAIAGLRRGGAGLRIAHLRRPTRDGFKAGALAHGLAASRGELIAIFDADFVPRRDFLRRMVPAFADPAVGMAQARWEHINGGASLLTRAQGLQLDAHFSIEHGVRAGMGYFFNFNGTAGIWRRRAIDDAGGWQSDTLTEDLDLSYRAQLRGWRFVYRDDVGVPAEVPAEIAAYRQQQQRWAQGGIQTARKVLPRLLAAPLPLGVKRHAAWHLLIHLSYPLLILVAAASLGIALLADPTALRRVMMVDGLLLTLATVSLAVFYGAAARARERRHWWRRLPLVPVIMVIGAGIAMGQTLAVLRGVAGSRTAFRRTPKYHLGPEGGSSWKGRSYRISSGAGAAAECLMGGLLLGVAALRAGQHGVPPGGLVVLVGLGLLCVGGGALLQQRAIAAGRD